ncbi:Meckelin [Chytriomyces hyalinus]|nr:Meckelin [Chytriomyces hyalinus]
MQLATSLPHLAFLLLALKHASAQSIASVSLPPFIGGAASTSGAGYCAANEAWDVAELYCRTCGVIQTVSASQLYFGIPGSQHCTCAKGYYLYGGSNLLDSFSACLKCPDNKISSLDQTFCLNCPTDLAIVNGQPTCPCGTYQYLATRDSNNAALSTAECRPCPYGSYPSPDASTCISCPQAGMFVKNIAGTYVCKCNVSLGYFEQPIGAQCVNNTAKLPILASTTIAFQTAMGPSGLANAISNFASDYFANYMESATLFCRNDWNEASCQMLGNMAQCVLQFYDTSSTACSLYAQIYQTRPVSKESKVFNRRIGMPWLYYSEIPSQIALVVPNITVNLSNPPKTGMLNFVLAAYSAAGEFLGYQYLKNQFSFCTNSDISDTPWLAVGHNYRVTCKINIANVVNSTIDTIFYDPFLLDDAGNYIPVPVRILNLAQNQYGYDFNYAGDVFTRRFFLIDNISGVSKGKLQVLRVPTSISFSIMKTIENTGQIYLPIMDIMYAERVVNGYIDPADTSVYASPTFEFSMSYGMTMEGFWSSMQVMFSLSTAGLLTAAIYRTLRWSKRNTAPGENMDMLIVGQSVINICGCAGATYFWYLTAICSYRLFFYKGQSTLYLLIPTKKADIYIFTCVLITATVLQTAYIIFKVYIQCKSNIFFFDWEKSRGKLSHSSTATLPSKDDPNGPKNAPVSVWRTIFMANQWHSLQTVRKVSIEFQLVWMYFILEGMGIMYAATAQPNIRSLVRAPRSPILTFAVDALVWIGLAGLQLAFRYLIYDRFYRDRLLQYADLLSIANVSLIVFDEKRHGYYIHGRSVHHAADTNFADLNENLRREENDMVPARGLDHTDQQVFEIFVTAEMRAMYDKIYGIVAASDPFTQMKGANLRLNGAAAKQISRKMKSADEAAVTAHMTVTKFLSNFIDKNFKEFQYTTRDKTFTEKILGATPDVHHGSVFLNDPRSFSHAMLRGIEPGILICYALIFVCADIAFDSVPAAALVIYVIDATLVFVRTHFGERNLSIKTLLDWKFLI